MRRQPSFTRADRLEHLMADEVERLLAYEVRSPLALQVKVVHTHLSPDLGHLRVNYVLHSGTEPPPALQVMLEQAASFVSRTVAETLQLRKKPTIAFHFDRDAMRMARVESLLRDDKARAAAVVPGEAGTEPTTNGQPSFSTAGSTGTTGAVESSAEGQP